MPRDFSKSKRNVVKIKPNRLGLCLVFLCALSLSTSIVKGNEPPPNEPSSKVWQTLKQDLFANQSISHPVNWLTLEAPRRAHDAALVPVTIKANPPKGNYIIKHLTLLIDNNPVPIAAEFELSEKLQPLHIETRVRVDQYSHIRAIIRTDKGKLFMATKYVKAAGGCSAPALKDKAAKMSVLGQTKLRQFTPKKNKVNQQRDVQLMIRHPNYSGLQMNQTTGYYIPAHYVSEITIKVNEEQLMKINGAISLSEDPIIRFHFHSNRKRSKLNIKIKDTEGLQFQNEWPLKSLIHPKSDT